MDRGERRRAQRGRVPAQGAQPQRADRARVRAISRRCRARTTSLGVPRGGRWREILNSDAKEYGGAGWGSLGGVDAAPVGAHGGRIRSR
jgi:1,4-alpha-glucan branching enzyme